MGGVLEVNPDLGFRFLIPNRTLAFANDSMMEIQTGYFLWSGQMQPVGGTYFTEMRCVNNATGDFALAFGEWQNPAWVARLATIQEDISNINITIV